MYVGKTCCSHFQTAFITKYLRKLPLESFGLIRRQGMGELLLESFFFDWMDVLLKEGRKV